MNVIHSNCTCNNGFALAQIDHQKIRTNHEDKSETSMNFNYYETFE